MLNSSRTRLAGTVCSTIYMTGITYIEMIMVKTFKSPTGTLVLRDDQILHLKVKEGIDASIADVESFLVQKRLWSKEKLGLIIDRQEAYSAGMEIFMHGLQHVDREFAAIAYVVYSKLGKLASEEMIAYNFETIPTKIFYSFEEAVSWIKNIPTE